MVNNRWSSQSLKTKGYLQDRPVDLKTCAKNLKIHLFYDELLTIRNSFLMNKGINV